MVVITHQFDISLSMGGGKYHYMYVYLPRFVPAGGKS